MLTIRQEKASDVGPREALLDRAYGAIRFTKPSARLRVGIPARGLSLVAVENGAVVGTVRLWPVAVGQDREALLLGPLAVHPGRRNLGIGAALMRRVLREAERRGHAVVLLVGDAAYYARFGFSAERTGGLFLPGLVEPSRLLGCELVSGALDGVRGAIRAPRRPVRNSLAAAAMGLVTVPTPKAA